MSHTRRIASRASELRSLSAWAVGVAAGLGCSSDTCYEVDLCLTEAVSNIIRHGYADNSAHEIGVEIVLEEDALVMQIEDNARPFDPLAASLKLPASLDEATPSGRGIMLMLTGADGASYKRRGGRNVLTLRFALRR